MNATYQPRKPRQYETVNLTVPFSDLMFTGLPGVGRDIDIEITGEVDVVVQLNRNLSYHKIEGVGEVRLANLVSYISGNRIPLVKTLAIKLVDDLRGPKMANDMRIRRAALDLVEDLYDENLDHCGIRDQW